MKRKNQYGRWERRRAVTPMFLSGYVWFFVWRRSGTAIHVNRFWGEFPGLPGALPNIPIRQMHDKHSHRLPIVTTSSLCWWSNNIGVLCCHYYIILMNTTFVYMQKSRTHICHLTIDGCMQSLHDQIWIADKYADSTFGLLWCAPSKRMLNYVKQILFSEM